MASYNRITELFGIRYPLVQAGMVWCAPWELASAVSNAGGLGLIGSASMYPEVLRTHIRKCQAATDAPFGVNVPLIYPDIEEQMRLIMEEGVPVVFTSAGDPRTWTSTLKEAGVQVVHVAPSSKFARKAAEAGADAVVVEGFEAGGHNGREETTSLNLIPEARNELELPLIAAGGIATGRQMLAAMVLGADGVQMGTRFLASEESSAHPEYKQKVVEAGEGDTRLTLKELTPVRMMKNAFFEEVQKAYERGADAEELREILGKGRAKRGMFEGKLDEGELEVGQSCSVVDEILPAATIVECIIKEFEEAREEIRADQRSTYERP
ncbi:MAG: NAD(P)H-dependent flavin oxidoreductase [Flavobacteriales bacterium]